MKRLILLTLLGALPIAAATIPITSTGGETPGTVDLDWLVNGKPAYVTTTGVFPFPAWSANDAASSWISPQSNYHPMLADAGGAYVYTTTFDLTGLAHGTASIDFVVAVDNELTDVLINGTSTGITYAGFHGFSGSFNISSGFVAGVNTLSFLTWNEPSLTGNPNGLRVLITGATAEADAPPAVPEPGTLWLFGAGAILLASRRRRLGRADVAVDGVERQL